ncbi:hypothetical protein K490DRAFT_70500 [Saccharata proteae CBS 121410]|uniref:Smr domain-containing protein n=1 Tax=Saccharata proteae CBS 121410 TaxID=1314787 RepID=A0A9P4M3C3_9PEZI|nr:hypothetical protein K490DRAFT_70500 [Saccharata proteae CBS 121410]
MGEPISLLEREFCPPLDAAIVFALYSDFDGQKDALDLARQVLEPLKEAALVEQCTDFDPSGSSDARRGSSESLQTRSNSATDATSTGLSSLSLDNGSPGVNEHLEYLQGLGTDDQLARLMETFPTLKSSKISYILQKCGGDYEKATDELLNHAWFEDTEGIDGEKVNTKGIDSFASDYNSARGRKGKAKKKKILSAEEFARSSSEPATPPRNKWEIATKDIEFISSRTNTSAQTVTTIYHKHGASVPATIMAVIELDIESNKDLYADDATITQNSIDLVADFPSVEFPHAFALIRLTHPSTAAAHELAKALTSTSEPKPRGGLQVIPHYAPIDLSEPADLNPTRSLASSPVASSASYSAARSAAFTQASSYYRRGKSDHLMKAAAGYYGQVGRDAHAALQTASAAEADALAAAQSTSTQLDLHGIDVKNATRIARERVTAWWAGLGEARIKGYGGGRGGAGEGYRIITGLGRHSEGGRAKLGPAVVKMLVREGWKVEVQSGAVLVTGVARRS